MVVRPIVVCICGSMRFEEQMRDAARFESVKGSIVVAPMVNMRNPHPLWSVGGVDVDMIKSQLDDLHKRKIDLADEILIVSDETGYVGDSTRSEIAYAQSLGKPVRWYRSIVKGVDQVTNPDGCCALWRRGIDCGCADAALEKLDDESGYAGLYAEELAKYDVDPEAFLREGARRWGPHGDGS